MFAGLDLSPGSSALVLLPESGGVPFSYRHFKEPASKTDMLARFRMADKICAQIREFQPTFLCLEDYALGMGQNVSYQIAEVAGLIKHHLMDTHVPFALVNPSKLHSFVLKKRGVTKMDVIRYAVAHGFNEVGVRKTPGGPGLYQREKEDLSDAYVLATMARELNMILAEGMPPLPRDIFRDPETGLAFRADLLFNNEYTERLLPNESL